VDNREYGEHT